MSEKRRETIVFVAILLADRLSKYLSCRYMHDGASIPIIPNIFHITLVRNTGAAFGILRGYASIFIAITIVTIGLLVSYIKEKDVNRLPFILILAGAVGNLIDRFSFGYVIDFIDLRVWPVFNISDAVITIGAVLLAFRMFRRKKI